MNNAEINEYREKGKVAIASIGHIYQPVNILSLPDSRSGLVEVKTLDGIYDKIHKHFIYTQERGTDNLLSSIMDNKGVCQTYWCSCWYEATLLSRKTDEVGRYPVNIYQSGGTFVNPTTIREKPRLTDQEQKVVDILKDHAACNTISLAKKIVSIVTDPVDIIKAKGFRTFKYGAYWYVSNPSGRIFHTNPNCWEDRFGVGSIFNTETEAAETLLRYLDESC